MSGRDLKALWETYCNLCTAYDTLTDVIGDMRDTGVDAESDTESGQMLNEVRRVRDFLEFRIACANKDYQIAVGEQNRRTRSDQSSNTQT